MESCIIIIEINSYFMEKMFFNSLIMFIMIINISMIVMGIFDFIIIKAITYFNEIMIISSLIKIKETISRLFMIVKVIHIIIVNFTKQVEMITYFSSTIIGIMMITVKIITN